MNKIKLTDNKIPYHRCKWIVQSVVKGQILEKLKHLRVFECRWVGTLCRKRDKNDGCLKTFKCEVGVGGSRHVKCLYGERVEMCLKTKSIQEWRI